MVQMMQVSSRDDGVTTVTCQSAVQDDIMMSASANQRQGSRDSDQSEARVVVTSGDVRAEHYIIQTHNDTQSIF